MNVLPDETIVAYVKESLAQGHSRNSDFAVRSVSLANALQIEISFQALPRELNLSKLLLQIHPPEQEVQAPAISKQVMGELAEKKESVIVGSFADVRPVTIRFVIAN